MALALPYFSHPKHNRKVFFGKIARCLPATAPPADTGCWQQGRKQRMSCKGGGFWETPQPGNGGEDKHLLTLLVQLLNQFLIAWKAVLILFDYILLSPSELQHLNVVLIKAILENKTPLEYMRINTVYRPRWLKRYCYGLLCKYIFTRAFEIQIMQIRIQGLLKMQIIDLTDHKGSFETILGYSIM